MSELPLRNTANGSEIETRPIYIEDWLDTLPYIDFKKTANLIHEALVATNKADVKASVRIELIEIYNRPYQYYVESQIKAGAQHTLQTIDVMQSQLAIMKRIAVNLSYGCKIAVETAMNKKTLWKQNKPPIEAMLMSMNYLSHALIYSFLEYSPVPKNVWQQLNFIYDFAESLDSHKRTLSIPGANDRNIQTTIDHSYKRIMLASLVDPHHLPFGAIWEIYEQLNTWAEYTQVHPMQTITDTAGYFVFDLKKDNKAIPYSNFDQKNVTNKTRLLDATPLESLIQKQIDLIDMGQPVDKSISLSPFYVNSLLHHMLSAWGTPPKRYFPRKAKSGNLNLVTGLNAIYYFLNNGNAFQNNPLGTTDDEDEISVSEGQIESSNDSSSAHYTSEEWRIIDEGSGGYAAVRENKPKKAIRVGELVAIDLEGEKKSWAIGVVRWLMVSRDIHKIGLQIITDMAIPIALRACTGSKADRVFRPAFLYQCNTDENELSILADKGLFLPDRDMEYVNNEKQRESIQARNIVDSGMAYEVFSFEAK